MKINCFFAPLFGLVICSVVITACGESSQLVGRWESKTASSYDWVEFTNTEMSWGGKMEMPDIEEEPAATEGSSSGELDMFGFNELEKAIDEGMNVYKEQWSNLANIFTDALGDLTLSAEYKIEGDKIVRNQFGLKISQSFKLLDNDTLILDGIEYKRVKIKAVQLPARPTAQ